MHDLMTKTFANIVTLLNIVFGSLSLISTLEHNFTAAAIFILLAVVADTVDGRVARKFDAESELGKELDSLCDLVSFGVAPAILLYTQVLSLHYGIIAILTALLFIVCGALRLARFNVLNIKDYFIGVPITFAGLLLVAVSFFASGLHPLAILLAVLVLALSMISNFKVPKIR